jgi:autotransporter-associated beta strand protein
MLDVQTDGTDTAYALNVGSGNTVTLGSDVKTGTVGINHTLGSLAISANTVVDVIAGYNVVGGSPAITLGSVTLSSGVGAGSTTFVPTTANLNLGAVTTSTNSAKTLILDGTSAGNTITGSITNGSNVITLVKSNSSTWTLSNSSSYSGGTTINDGGGTLAITNAGALGTGSVNIGTGNTNASGELQLSNNIVVTSVPTINFESRLLSNGGGSADLENLSGNNSISANLNINTTGGTAVNILSTAGTLTLNGNLSSTGLSSSRGFDFYGAGNGVVTGIISDGTAQSTFIQKDGSGTWTLKGSNTFTGATTINAGTLAIDSSITGSANAALAKTPSITVASGAELHLLSVGGTATMINAAATLNVVTGSVIALDLSGGSQTIQSFVVNGTPAPAGVYSASTEPDGNTTYENLFEGNGSLNVNVPEPGCLGLVGLVAGGLLSRRRRRR